MSLLDCHGLIGKSHEPACCVTAADEKHLPRLSVAHGTWAPPPSTKSDRCVPMLVFRCRPSHPTWTSLSDGLMLCDGTGAAETRSSHPRCCSARVPAPAADSSKGRPMRNVACPAVKRRLALLNSTAVQSSSEGCGARAGPWADVRETRLAQCSLDERASCPAHFPAAALITRGNETPPAASPGKLNGASSIPTHLSRRLVP